MKNLQLKIGSLACLISNIITCSFAQTAASIDTTWRLSGSGMFSLNQVNFSNWAAGGENSLSTAAFLSQSAKYTKSKVTWDNQLDLAYGLTKIGNAKFQKNEDKIDLNSMLGYRLEQSKFYYTVLFNFKSQFADGFSKPEDSIPVSRFASPAYFLYSLGVDYKPNDLFSIFISPITGKTLLVSDQHIADAGTYGNEPLKIDNNGNIVHGKKNFTQLGAYLRGAYKQEIMTNINLQTKLELFSNYLKNPQNIAVNWEVLLLMKVNKYIAANLGTQMIYDDIIAIPVVKEINGMDIITPAPRLQFKEVFGIGLSYKY